MKQTQKEIIGLIQDIEKDIKHLSEDMQVIAQNSLNSLYTLLIFEITQY